MSNYLIINSRDLHEYSASRSILDLAVQLRDRGNAVTLYFVENGVLAARQGSTLDTALSNVAENGVRILAEDVALKARGITRMSAAVEQSNIDQLAELVADECDKVIWY